MSSNENLKKMKKNKVRVYIMTEGLIFRRVIRKELFEKATFEQRPEGKK